MANPLGIDFESKAFNAHDESVIERVSAYLMAKVSPKSADLHDDQQFDINDSHHKDKIPALIEYVNLFKKYFPQVRALTFYSKRGFADDKKWGWLEVLTQFVPAISWGVKYDKIYLGDPEMIELANLIYKKGKQVATGTLEIRAEKDEENQN